ncbi:MAG: hypothetical protein KKC37_14105, partial [Proteobacteria bacterium]|nr:hypothetical protein [Pseudomonadota bacterium]
NMRVSKNCCNHPYSFIAFSAHELSHVLLHSIGHPESQNEIYTEITPMLLGFMDLIKVGRKVEERKRENECETHITHHYGYFSDHQFDYIYNTIKLIYNQESNAKYHINITLESTKRIIIIAEKQISLFGNLLILLNKTKKLKTKDLDAIVRFHAPNYLFEFESSLSDIKKYMSKAEKKMQCDIEIKKIDFHDLQTLNNQLESKRIYIKGLVSKLNEDIKT